MPPSANPDRPFSEKFLVAFSFAGEERKLVSEVAHEVETRLGSGTVFYDEWHEDLTADVDGSDLKFQEVYEACELVVVCVSKNYDKKKWPSNEYAVIRERLMIAREPRGRGRYSVLPLRVGDGNVRGIRETGVVPDARKKGISRTVDLIIRRLNRVRFTQSAPVDQAPSSSTPARDDKPRIDGELLHHLCDRDRQKTAFAKFLSKAAKRAPRRPVVVIVHGDERGAHESFVDRMRKECVPGKLKHFGLTDEAPFMPRIYHEPEITATNTADLSAAVLETLAKGLEIKGTFEKEETLLLELHTLKSPVVIIPEFDFTSREAFVRQQFKTERCYVKMLLDYWSDFPDLPPGCVLITFICVTYMKTGPLSFWDRKWPFAKEVDHALVLETWINTSFPRPDKGEVAAEEAPPPEPTGFRRMLAQFRPAALARHVQARLPWRLPSAAPPPASLPAPGSRRHAMSIEMSIVKVEDVVRWFRLDPVLRHNLSPMFREDIQRQILAGQLEQPMVAVLKELEAYLKKELKNKPA